MKMRSLTFGCFVMLAATGILQVLWPVPSETPMKLGEASTLSTGPVVSVITYVFLRKNDTERARMLIDRCVASVQLQNIPIEHIIVDDGSEMNLKKLLRPYSNVKLIRKANTGILHSTETVRTAFHAASGDFAIVLASDDEFRPGALFLLRQALLSEESAAGVLGDALYVAFDRDDRIIAPEFQPDDLLQVLEKKNVVNICALMWRRALLDELDFAPNFVGFASDYYFVVKLASKGPVLRLQQTVLNNYDHKSAMRRTTTTPHMVKTYRAPRLQYVRDIAAKLATCRRPPSPQAPKVLIVGHNFNFLEDFIEAAKILLKTNLKTHIFDLNTKPKRLTIDQQVGLKEKLDWADTIFVEWASLPAEIISAFVPPSKRLVVRVHRFELGIVHFPRIRWGLVDTTIFIAKWVRQEAKHTLGLTGNENPEMVVIPNLLKHVCTGNDTISQQVHRQHRIGLFGGDKVLKNPLLALQIAQRLHEQDSRWKLEIAGRYPAFNGTRDKAYWDGVSTLWVEMQTSGALEHVGFLSGEASIGKWLSSLGFILSTSDVEGSHQAIAEGMMCGCVPIVRNWRGASDIYPPENIFNSAASAAAIASEAAWDWRKESLDASNYAATRFRRNEALKLLFTTLGVTVTDAELEGLQR